jgi:transcriptional regulator with XRE-family HTH domain
MIVRALSHRRFKKWVRWLGSGSFLALKLKISPSMVTRLRNGERTPSQNLARRIERLAAKCGHEIPMNGWGLRPEHRWPR